VKEKVEEFGKLLNPEEQSPATIERRSRLAKIGAGILAALGLIWSGMLQKIGEHILEVIQPIFLILVGYLKAHIGM
jgi:hypothetical protein